MTAHVIRWMISPRLLLYLSYGTTIELYSLLLAATDRFLGLGEIQQRVSPATTTMGVSAERQLKTGPWEEFHKHVVFINPLKPFMKHCAIAALQMASYSSVSH